MTASTALGAIPRSAAEGRGRKELPMAEKRKIILDVDTGTDDAIAIMESITNGKDLICV